MHIAKDKVPVVIALDQSLTRTCFLNKTSGTKTVLYSTRQKYTKNRSTSLRLIVAYC